MKINALLAAVGLVGAATVAHATTFHFLFDNGGSNEPDGTISTPIVGVGEFSTPETLTPGLYALSALRSYALVYEFANGAAFSNADMATPPDGVALEVTTYGSGLRAVWAEAPGSPDADGGPYGGSLDLVNTKAVLSFEPSYAGGNNVYQNYAVGVYPFIGNYLATTVPEPASWAVMLIGLAGLGAALRSRRRLAAARA